MEWNSEMNKELWGQIWGFLCRGSSEMCMHGRYKNTRPSVFSWWACHTQTLRERPDSNDVSTIASALTLTTGWSMLRSLYCSCLSGDTVSSEEHTHTKQNMYSEILQQKNIWEHKYFLFLNTVFQLTKNVHPWSTPRSPERSPLPPWWMRKANCFTHCALQNSEIRRSQCWPLSHGSTQTHLLQTPMPTVCNRLTLFTDKTSLGWLTIFMLLHGSVWSVCNRLTLFRDKTSLCWLVILILLHRNVQCIKMNTDGEFSSLAIKVVSVTTVTQICFESNKYSIKAFKRDLWLNHLSLPLSLSLLLCQSVSLSLSLSLSASVSVGLSLSLSASVSVGRSVGWSLSLSLSHSHTHTYNLVHNSRSNGQKIIQLAYWHEEHVDFTNDNQRSHHFPRHPVTPIHNQQQRHLYLWHCPWRPERCCRQSWWPCWARWSTQAFLPRSPPPSSTAVYLSSGSQSSTSLFWCSGQRGNAGNTAGPVSYTHQVMAKYLNYPLQDKPTNYYRLINNNLKACKKNTNSLII